MLAGAARDVRTRRSRIVALVLVLCPLISGVFFGLVSALLVFPSGGAGHAFVVGVLVGGAMFAANAAALCIVQSTGSDGAASAVDSVVDDVPEARAS